MGPTPLALALAAAAVHAGWNLLLARERDTEAAGAVAVAIGAIAFAPVLVASGSIDASAAPFIAVSAALEVVYLALLANAYARASLTLVYPLARGSAPVLVLVGEALFLGLAPSGLAVGGILLVAAGVVLIRGREPPPLRYLVLALAIGACIASYTIVDKHGITHADPLVYLEVVFGSVAIAQLAHVGARRGAAALRAAVSPQSALAGIGFFGSCGLTLLALDRARAAPVAAVRETSVLLATAFAIGVGWERARGWRVVGAALVVAGIAAIALG